MKLNIQVPHLRRIILPVRQNYSTLLGANLKGWRTLQHDHGLMSNCDVDDSCINPRLGFVFEF